MLQDNPEPIAATNSTSRIIQPKFFYPNVKSVVILFFLFILYSIISGVSFGIGLAILNGLNMKSQLMTSFLNLLAYVIPQLLLIRYTIKKVKRQSHYPVSIDFNKVPAWVILVAIVSAIALVVLLDRTTSWIPMPVAVEKFFEKIFTKDIFTIITIAIAAPILEEIFVRGIVLKGLLKNYSPYKSILISAILFSALHLNPWQAIPAFLGGLFIGWVYYKTRSIIPGIIIHATINIIALLLLFSPRRPESFFELLGTTYYLIAFILATMIFCSGCYIINKKLPEYDGQSSEEPHYNLENVDKLNDDI